MAKNAHGTRSNLIHCDNCGEDYSTTYKRCPFCGARPAAAQPAGRSAGEAGGGRAAQNSTRSRQPEEDDYVFDGQDVFDDIDRERDEGGSPFRGGGTGGRRQSGGLLDISPTTLIGFVVSGVIVIAAILIVLFVVIPMIKGGNVETATNSPNSTLPGGSQSQTISPSQLPTSSPSPSSSQPVDPGTDPTTSPSPSVPVSPSPSTSVPPVTGGLTFSALGRTVEEITISDKWPAPVQLSVNGASGAVTWASSNSSVVTVSANGLVTAVNKGTAYITATDSAGKSQKCLVRSTITLTATAPSPSVSPSPSASPSPSVSPSPSASPSPSQSPAPSGGKLTLTYLGNEKKEFTMSAAFPTPVTLGVNGATGTVTWTSSNTSVATVDASGKVSMVGKGQCTITATDASGNTGSCRVLVS